MHKACFDDSKGHENGAPAAVGARKFTKTVDGRMQSFCRSNGGGVIEGTLRIHPFSSTMQGKAPIQRVVPVVLCCFGVLKCVKALCHCSPTPHHPLAGAEVWSST